MKSRKACLRWLFVLSTFSVVAAFQPPILGIGSVLFPVRGRVIESLAADFPPRSEAKRQALLEASDFFVDSFWTAKVGGGTRLLTDRQLSTLQQSQLAEFIKRYGSSSKKRCADLLLCRVNSIARTNKQNSVNNIVACAGVEVDTIPEGSLKGPALTRAPLMSNLAVSRKFRRRGLAETMVQAVEEQVQDWGYDQCFLYVEQRNVGAVQLYKKLGYRSIWQDKTAQTLLPTVNGDLKSSPTVILCMQKKLRLKSSWQSLFSR